MKIRKQQIELVRESRGLISFIVRLDYLPGEREVVLYTSLLAHLRQPGGHNNLWMALPGEIETRWRPLHTELLVAGLE